MSEKSDEQKGSRSRSPKLNNERRYSGKTGRDTNSNDANSLRRRVFIGNLATDKTSKSEIEEIFGKFGEIESCSLHNNYGFVQYAKDQDADVAVLELHGKTIFGKRIDVNLAGVRRKAQTKDQYEGVPKPEDVVPENMRHLGKKPRNRSRSPMHSDDRPPYGRSLSPMSRYEELYRRDDPYMRPKRDAYGPPLDAPRDYFNRGKLYPDQRDELYPVRYERDFPRREDPYWRPYDGHRPPPLRVRPAIDCEIVALSKDESRYADEVESRLRGIGLVCNIGFPPPEVPVVEVVDRITQAGTLYAVVVSGQNAQHRSCTLNILHGTRQEHRNMPLNDALSFVARNFDTYLKALRDPYWGGPSPTVSYGHRDDARGYPPPQGHRLPPVEKRNVPSNNEKEMSNEQLAAMIEKLRREKQQRDTETYQGVPSNGIPATSTAASYYNQTYPPQSFR